MKITFLLILFFLPFVIKAQTSIEYLDINNVKAGINTGGNMFFNKQSGTANYEFPKGSGKHSTFTTALWVAGFDSSNALHVAAQTYRQGGSDYWSGPLENDVDSISPMASDLWDKIWKVNATTIDSFKQITFHTLANTPSSILDWPGRGNIYALGKNGVNLGLNNTRDYAPFVDVNNDSIYNPLDGDFPAILGKQALWWIYNDFGGIHTQSKGLPFHIEIQAMAYACDVAPLQDVTFYAFKLINRSNMLYHSTRLAVWTDIDLGNYIDDYIGFDSVSRMGIGYNKNQIDNIYGSNLTQTGYKILHSPGDSAGYQAPIGSFIFFENGANSPKGDPNNDIEYYYYLNSKWNDGSSLIKNCIGIGNGNPVNTIFADDPSMIGGNSEKQCSNGNGDRRFVIATSDFNFSPNESQVISFAIINTPLGSSNDDFSVIKNLAAQVQQYEMGCASTMAMPNFTASFPFQIFPNPSNTEITINSTEPITTISIVNIDGQVVYQTKVLDKSLQHKLNTTALANGNYLLQIKTPFLLNQLLLFYLTKLPNPSNSFV